LVIAHAIAEAAMFLPAGRIAEAAGHDVVARLDRATVRPGTACFAFALALIGTALTAAYLSRPLAAFLRFDRTGLTILSSF
jgi:NADH:ubiquinone oxidoreductase subunit 5 (subunit L)/multisubunit Na+/H+ antiporter MnhA subunit